MFCQKCGTQNSENDNFCKNCGNNLKQINQEVLLHNNS